MHGAVYACVAQRVRFHSRALVSKLDVGIRFSAAVRCQGVAFCFFVGLRYRRLPKLRGVTLNFGEVPDPRLREPGSRL